MDATRGLVHSSVVLAHLTALADALKARRAQVLPKVQLYRELHGAAMHKVEQVGGPLGDPGQRQLAAVTGRLAERLPVQGRPLAELARSVAADPDWLARPYGPMGTGLEALVHETVAAVTDSFDAARNFEDSPAKVADMAWAMDRHRPPVPRPGAAAGG